MNLCILLFVEILTIRGIFVTSSQSGHETVKAIVNRITAIRSDHGLRFDRPFVVVSFAQSLDGFMAPWSCEDNKITAANYPLSSESSLLLTHAIRSEVDAILIGGRTLSIDSPRLTNRLWPGKKESYRQPRAVILDTNLEHFRNVTCRIRNPIICCSHAAAAGAEKSLLPVDAEILPCETDYDGKLSILDVLSKLRQRFDVESIMVEGGAAMLSSFFVQNTVDLVCITIAPKILHAGISPFYATNSATPIDLSIMSPLHFTLGPDVVILSRWSPYHT